MVTVTFEEIELNAVVAALDDRLQKMIQQRWALKEQRDSLSNRFAIEVTDMAIAHVMKAKATIVAAIPEPEYPADMTVARLSVLEVYQGEGR